MKQKISTVLKYFLVLLFIAYYGEATLFVHTHHYSHSTVTHSHPYLPDASGLPSHQHSASQLETIDSLTSLHFWAGGIYFLPMAAILLFSSFFFFRLTGPVLFFSHYFSLRAPPFSQV